MSAMIPSNSVYEYLYARLQTAGHRNECDEFYSYVIHRHMKRKDIQKESLRLVESWRVLNSKSYAAAYKSPYTNEESYEVIKDKLFPLCAIQMLKFALCISSNIEVDTIISDGMKITEQEQKDVALLREWIADIQYSIISNTVTFKTAGWSEYTPSANESREIFPSLN